MTGTGPRPPLFQRALGADWHALSSSAQALHDFGDRAVFEGSAHVERGHSFVARTIAWAFGFPLAGQDMPVTVVKERVGSSEIWERDFAGTRFSSRLSAANRTGHVLESLGPFTFELALPVRNGEMRLDVVCGKLFGIPVPRVFLPVSRSREFEQDGVFNFDIALQAPVTGHLIVRYRGWLKPVP